MNTPAFFSMLAQAFGWAVLHSLWQIALLWLLFKAASWLLRGRNQAIYLMSLAAMLAATGWFAMTFTSAYSRISLTAQTQTLESHTLQIAVPGVINAGEITEAAAPGFLESVEFWIENHATQVGWAWAVCVALLWLRLLGGWWMVQRLRHRDVVLPGEAFQAQCATLSKKLKINALVRLLESPHVREPLTLGFWKPIVLFPTGMLLALSPAQVEALLLHELAHIRRYDYLINLFQLALETCFFYHPLFWLISRDARVRREFCCDDVVLYHTSDPILYAKTLTDLQLSFLHPTTQFTMNATGKSRFTERILRIAGISPNRESRPNLLIVMLLPTLIALSSWWPSQAATLPADFPSIDITPFVSDTVPPRKAAKPAPQAAAIKVQGKPASPAPAEPEKVAIEVVKMNVLYIGVDNPLRIAIAGVPASEIQVEMIGDGAISGSNGNYTAVVRQPGEVTVRVSRKVGSESRIITDQKYRAKRIPDPAPRLGGLYKGGIISKEKLLNSLSIQAMLDNFDFDAYCEVVGYELTILPKEQDPVTFNVIGANITPYVRAWFEKLLGDGDAIFFDEVKVKCPGDAATRNLGGIAFKLKPEAK
jgi:beta-lactamase regulating signal transducer with metallopeptidase domain